MTQEEHIVQFTEAHLNYLNEKLSKLSPQEVLRWSLLTIPNLYQTTAFGLTGLVITDMISKLDMGGSTKPVDLIFIDTLHHFPQTLELVEKVANKYNNIKVNVIKPKNCENEEEFRLKYGDFLWEKDEDKYDYLVKVEPLKRAYKNFSVDAVFTGRRRSQGGARDSLPILQFEKSTGILKINPLASWDFNQVFNYIKENDVPYNELLDLGYKSVGDYHSTVPIAEGEDERSGRWKGKAKTECGIHQTERFKDIAV